MKKVVIFSLNFNSAHISHLLASYMQCQDLGYDPILYLHKDFEPFISHEKVNYLIYKRDSLPKEIHIGMFLFPSLNNITQSVLLKVFHRAKIIYLYHEPLDSMKSYIQHNNIFEVCVIVLKDLVSLFTLILSDLILLPSEKSYSQYEKNNYRIFNKEYYYFPLLYPDYNEDRSNMSKLYFSYIGGACREHAFEKYLLFVKKAIEQKFMVDKLQFCIATRTHLDLIDPVIKEIMDSDRVVIQQGRHLSNEEISDYYSKSYIVWNAYERTNQSGVLANSFMFGVPLIIMKSNMSEYVTNHGNVVAINNNEDYQEICDAVKCIMSKYSAYVSSARESFLHNFYYKAHNEQFKKLVDRLFIK